MSEPMPQRETRGPQLVAPFPFLAHLAAMLLLHVALPIGQWNVGASRWWGLPPAVAGLLLVVVAAGRFHRRSTTLRPYAEPRELVTDGLHRYSRNPMYLGLLLSLAGAWVMLGTISPGLVIPPFYLLIRYRYVAHEERVMRERFGDAFRAYERRVRRWL